MCENEQGGGGEAEEEVEEQRRKTNSKNFILDFLDFEKVSRTLGVALD